MSGLKILLINAEKASGPMEMPSNSLPNSDCWFPMTNCVKRRDCSSSDIWFHALFISAVV